MKSESLLTASVLAARLALSSLVPLRYLRNRLRFQGLAIHPSVNHLIRGRFEYGEGVVLSEGCNLIVPDRATLRLGNGCFVGRYVEVGPLGTIDIGERTSIQDRSILIGDVVLGRYCMLSLNVLMTSGTHYYDLKPHLLIRDQDRSVSEDVTLCAQHSRPIVVGEDCWLGMNSAVMPGVNLGRGCVIGTNAVVTHDLPPYSVAVGAPAQIIKQRLAFVPPRRINWSEMHDYPYFYAGFQLAYDERERNRKLCGHLAQGDFALWLEGGGAELRVRARAASGNETDLECSGHRTLLTGEWEECRFPTPPKMGPALFKTSGKGIVVSEAWIA